MKQQTIKDKISISGVGIHTGVYTNLTLLPANENTGILFKRTDLENPVIIPADIDFVHSTNRSTNLQKDKNIIHTVEHVLAAVSGSQIDNIIIEVDNCEIPILDGSSSPFLELINKVGIKQQLAERKYYTVKKKIVFEQDGSNYTLEPSDHLKASIKIDYNSKILGIQTAELEDISDFSEKISTSRTFCFLHELEELLENNLIKGGDINNAIVIVENKITNKRLKELSEIFKKEDIKVGKDGILNNLKLRYKNEAARHKLLDIIGDFTLLGIPIKGKITAYKPGHKHNIGFIKKLRNIMKEDMKNTAPFINFDEPPVYNREQIKLILPHRDPFLFIDEIRDLGSDYIIGVKFVNENESYFTGHFPGAPVMPGVLQLETMAQAGGVLILNTVENPEEYLTYFMKIDNAKFKQKVIPGDTIIFRLNLISPIRRGLCHMHGKGFVNGKLVVEADLLAQIAKKQL